MAKIVIELAERTARRLLNNQPCKVRYVNGEELRTANEGIKKAKGYELVYIPQLGKHIEIQDIKEIYVIDRFGNGSFMSIDWQKPISKEDMKWILNDIENMGLSEEELKNRLSDYYKIEPTEKALKQVKSAWKVSQTYSQRKEAVRQMGIDYTTTDHEGESLDQVIADKSKLEKLAKRYGLLKEFRENGVC